MFASVPMDKLILCISVLGTVLKTLLVSIVVRNVRCEGYSTFSASYICSVRVTRSVAVESLALKPC